MKKIFLVLIILSSVTFAQKTVTPSWIRANFVEKDSVLTWVEMQDSIRKVVSTGSGVVYVRDYITDYDTTISWNDAIQAAIDNFSSATGLRVLDGNLGGKVILPNTAMGITEPIRVHSGVRLVGSGNATAIYEKAGFSGRGIIELYGASGYVDDAEINDIRITSTTQPAIVLATTVNNIVNSRFINLTLNVPNGLILNKYCQAVIIDNIYSFGQAIDTLIYLQGNFNFIYNVDIEGQGGSGTDAYIIIGKAPYGSVGNELKNILIEPSGFTSKTGIMFDQVTSVTLENYWFEPQGTDGYMIRIQGCDRIYIKGFAEHFFTSTSKLKIDSTNYVFIDEFNTDAEDKGVYDYIEKDSSSSIYIGFLYTRGYESPYNLSKLHGGYTFDKVISKMTYVEKDDSAHTGISAQYLPQFYGNNWFPAEFSSTLLSFSPSDISGLQLHYEGDVGLTSTGWQDQTANDDTLRFYNTPTLGTQNGVPTVIFDGVNQYGKTDTTIGLNQPISVYAVFKPITYDTTLSHVIIGTTNNAYLFNTPYDSQHIDNYWALTQNGDWIPNYSIALGRFSLVKMVFDSSNSSLEVNNAGKSYGTFSSDSLGGIAIAGNPTLDAIYSNTEFSALLVYNKELSDYEDNLLTDYLKTKYGLTLGLWNYSTSPDTVSSIISEVSDKDMVMAVWDTTIASVSIYRSFYIPSSMVGREFTFSVYAKGTATYIYPYINGCGLRPTEYMRGRGDDWHIITQTFTPQEAGYIKVGIGAINADRIYLDQPYLTLTVRK